MFTGSSQKSARVEVKARLRNLMQIWEKFGESVSLLHTEATVNFFNKIKSVKLNITSSETDIQPIRERVILFCHT